ncbi:MarR family winged helix-turn-helix transcriptional regulator [Kutzneria buriramensis]|uniref:DNA-binding MarR family transcriptional regulator n=1 Tax=Kutzneria buriramensis TaxID=1045776 RepID=A0A3E0HBL6_9PSEU|nr:MarR family transcriptional regulator [Kutzneria buriramensis]REH41825.1 DNA-binding MarR family transcriptional regulator [Kutzneria buriramensis]
MTDEPQSRWTGPGRSPGFLLWRVTLAWQRAMRAALAPHDLTHVQFVLLASTWWLGDHEEPPTQQRLAAQAGTDPMMTSQVIRKLADRGLVNRAPDPRDARALRIVVTPDGREVLAAALRDVEQSDAEYFASVDDDFVTGLARLLR